MFEFNLKLSLPHEMQQLQEWVLERAAGSQIDMTRLENPADARSPGMSGSDTTDDLGLAIVKLLGWILVFDALDSD